MNKSEPANRRREERRVKARSTNPATPEQIGPNGRDRYGGRSAGSQIDAVANRRSFGRVRILATATPPSRTHRAIISSEWS
ncbi:hypothetical protein MRX96_016120 [Rhipicephalus microplus]